MIWRIIGIIGAGSFFVTGFNVLADPNCISADFGGGRVIQVSCRNDSYGSFSGVQAGLIAISIGIALIIFIFFNQFKKLYKSREMNTVVKDEPVATSGKLVSIKICNYCECKVAMNSMKCPSCEGTYFDVKQVSFSSLVTGEIESVNDLAEEQTKKCPMCAEIIKAEALKCRFCGSGLEPTGMKKASAKFESFIASVFSKENASKTVGVLLAFVIILVYTFFQLEKSKEYSALERNGVICVYGSDEATNYGCADYPQLTFSFCSKAPVHWPYLPDSDNKGLTTDSIAGKLSRDDGCLFSDDFYKDYQYLIEVDTEFRERLGDYRLNTLGYATEDIDSFIEGAGIRDLIIRVALKN
jgi:hypothetical protein